MSAAAKKNLFVFSFIAPSFLLYVVFFVYPNVDSMLVSLHKWNATSTKKTFIGIKNYIKLFEDPHILQVLYNTFYIAILSISATLVLSLFFSTIVTYNRKYRLPESDFYKSVYFFPNLLSVVVTSILWVQIYNPNIGILNGLLDVVGLDTLKRVWLGDPVTVKACIAIYGIWGGIGFYFVIFMSAIQNIPAYFYEAAEIDGASKLRQFFNITLPLISNIIKINLIFGISGSLNGQFASIKIMTDGGPNYASEVISSYMYAQSFGQANFGYGAAIGMLMFVLAVLLCYLTIKAFAKGDVYEY